MLEDCNPSIIIPPRAGGARLCRGGGRCNHATGPSAARHRAAPRRKKPGKRERAPGRSPGGWGLGARTDGPGTGPSSKRSRDFSDCAQPPPPTRKGARAEPRSVRSARDREAAQRPAATIRHLAQPPSARRPARRGRASEARTMMRAQAAEAPRRGAARWPLYQDGAGAYSPPEAAPRGEAEHYSAASGGRRSRGAIF